MAFHTFSGYVEAVCVWASGLYPHPDGMVAGVAGAVKARPWRSSVPTGRALPPRAGQILRNGWATEVLLNAPRALGGGDLVSFANLWAPVQAYYAVFNSFTALAHVVTANPPETHAKLLNWAASAAASSATPFVVPWTARVSGPPNAWVYDDFGPDPLDLKMSNLTAPTLRTAPSLMALALRTTRGQQIEDRKDGWIAAQRPTKSGGKRKNLATSALTANATKVRATTLFDLLWRLRMRSNYKEGDAFLSGALSPAAAATFHDSLCDIVAATLLTVEIYLAHQVGAARLLACAKKVPIPASLEPSSVLARSHLW